MSILLLGKLLILASICQATPFMTDLMCPICEPEFCPKAVDDCPQGITTDRCGCCSVGLCLLSVGDRCLNTANAPAMSQTDLRRYGSCGEWMECRQRTDLDPRLHSKESTCQCLDSHPVCGSDNKTYATACNLYEAKKSLNIAHRGPCDEAPLIAVGPAGGNIVEGDSLALDCEIHGVPVPSVSWLFVASDGSTKVLPGDDMSIVVQTRGGPESSMLTSWVQIVSVRAEDDGTYICMASNSLGETRAAAYIRVQSPL